MNTFTCYKCKKTFEKAWTDEEAVSEFKRDFPNWDITSSDYLCDDCHKELVMWRKNVEPNLNSRETKL